ncbi:2-oxo-4-hydroxy-4-carboxy-5-ureidoimidazoline decarboxylase [Actinocorallia sp. B10E7]|uniref:2-oxo-4-hydroxy-4-carboxy-5-ureidoimidazoline decarboxylase n=1 Tax=Actinocorallia sp. B10E7 TaxID=3153558 RepID=UPI00325D08EF
MEMARFDALPGPEAEEELLTCCAVPEWARKVAYGRPYPDSAALLETGSRALAGLSWDAVLTALSAHPRIGERAGGDSREAAWSRQEQAGAQDADRDALTAANLAYEERFGHVFLICATGLSGAEMLAAARARLEHDEETERAVVRTELDKIVRIRLRKLVES